MSSAGEKVHDVLVVGAGPVGLALALNLARRGRDVLVLEKEAATARHSRAPGIWPRTQEILADLGVMKRFLENGIALPRMALWDVDRECERFVLPLEELSGQTRFPHLLILPQSETERLLLEALQRESTAEVRFASEVTALSQRAGKVAAEFTGPAGNGTVEARFAAGCDGAHSKVRETIGATLDGMTYKVEAALADVGIAAEPELRFPRLSTDPHLVIAIRMTETVWRLILPYREAGKLALDQRVKEAVPSVLGERDWRPVWQSEFRLHRRIASSFREGRIVLAGDAAHLNSPVGGQGMNAGIQDTAWLADALDEALEKDSTEPLDRYARGRRREIAKGVNRFTDILTRLLLTGGGKLLRPVFTLVGWALRFPPFRRRVLRNIAMLR